MSLYQKCRDLLFEEFIHRNYRGIGGEKVSDLLTIKIDKVIQTKQERDLAFQLLRVLTVLLVPSKSISLKEALCRVCEALDLDYYVLYLTGKRKNVMHKKVHYSRTPEMRDRILSRADTLSAAEWSHAQKNHTEFFPLAATLTPEKIDSIEQKNGLMGGIVWRKTNGSGNRSVT